MKGSWNMSGILCSGFRKISNKSSYQHNYFNWTRIKQTWLLLSPYQSIVIYTYKCSYFEFENDLLQKVLYKHHIKRIFLFITSYHRTNVIQLTVKRLVTGGVSGISHILWIYFKIEPDYHDVALSTYRYIKLSPIKKIFP